MSLLLASAMIPLAASATSSTSLLFRDDDHLNQSLWDQFKDEYKKEYINKEEESQKYSIFLENLKRIDCKLVEYVLIHSPEIHCHGLPMITCTVSNVFFVCSFK